MFGLVYLLFFAVQHLKLFLVNFVSVETRTESKHKKNWIKKEESNVLTLYNEQRKRSGAK